MVSQLRLIGNITESEIRDTVKSIRDSVQTWYDWARQKGRYDFITNLDGSSPTMKRLQISMGRVFDSRHRELRLKVTDVILGIEDLELGSFKDLYPAEASPLIDAFNDSSFTLVLNAIGTDVERWRKRLGNIAALKRPNIASTILDSEGVDDGDWW